MCTSSLGGVQVEKLSSACSSSLLALSALLQGCYSMIRGAGIVSCVRILQGVVGRIAMALRHMKGPLLVILCTVWERQTRSKLLALEGFTR